MNKVIKECIKEHDRLLKIADDLDEKYEDAKETKDEFKYKTERDLAITNVDNYIWNTFSKIVFDIYVQKKPKLKDRFSGKIKTWDEVFGDDFDQIDRSSRESLVGLVENDGRYKLK